MMPLRERRDAATPCCFRLFLPRFRAMLIAAAPFSAHAARCCQPICLWFYAMPCRYAIFDARRVTLISLPPCQAPCRLLVERMILMARMICHDAAAYEDE